MIKVLVKHLFGTENLIKIFPVDPLMIKGTLQLFHSIYACMFFLYSMSKKNSVDVMDRIVRGD